MFYAPFGAPMFGGGDPPPLHIRLAHKTHAHDVYVDGNATFGELRYEGHSVTGLPMDGFKLLFRGRERADGDSLMMSGVKNGSIVQVAETAAYQARRAAALAGMQRAQHNPQVPVDGTYLPSGARVPVAAAAAAANGAQLQAGAWNPAFPPMQHGSGAVASPGGATSAASSQRGQQQQWNPEFPPHMPNAATSAQQAQQPLAQNAQHAQRAHHPQAQHAQHAAHAQAPPRPAQQPGFNPSFPPLQPNSQPQQQRPVIGPQPQPPAAAQARGVSDGPVPIGPQPRPEARPPIGPQPQPQSQPPADPAAALKAGLLGKVDAAQRDMDSLAQQVDELTAHQGPLVKESPAHKQALLLLELLTRVMLALDGVRAPDGGETPVEVRAARKAAVVRAQQLIDRVEAAKVAAT